MVGVAVVGETPSLTGESVGKWGRDEQVSCIVPSLAPPPQAATQHSKEVCPALGEYLRPQPLTTYQEHRDKEIGPK